MKIPYIQPILFEDDRGTAVEVCCAPRMLELAQGRIRWYRLIGEPRLGRCHHKL